MFIFQYFEGVCEWAKIQQSSGHTTLSILGGDVRKCRLAVSTATLKSGLSELVPTYGVCIKIADFSVMHIGMTLYGGMMKPPL